MFTGFARTLNGGVLLGIGRVPPPHIPVHPLRAGDHKGRPYVPPLSFGHFPRERGQTEWVEWDGSSVVWLACRSRRHASASEHLRHNPTVAGLSICVAS